MIGRIIKKISVLCLLCVFGIISNVYAKDFVYSGKVIDVETKEPIQGAAVVASWLKERPTLAGPSTSFFDVKEALTDKEGKWQIKGHKGNCYDTIPRLFQFIGIPCTREPTFIVFKPGYCSWSFNALSIDICKEKMKGYNYTYSNNIGEIIELPKLTTKEDRLKAQRISPDTNGAKETDKKIINFLKLINEEKRYLGIPEYPLEGLENEK